MATQVPVRKQIFRTFTKIVGVEKSLQNQLGTILGHELSGAEFEDFATQLEAYLNPATPASERNVLFRGKARLQRTFRRYCILATHIGSLLDELNGAPLTAEEFQSRYTKLVALYHFLELRSFRSVVEGWIVSKPTGKMWDEPDGSVTHLEMATYKFP